LEDLGFRSLRVAKVHHFVEQFVDNDKIVADRFFFKCFEILRENFDDFVEEEEDLGGVGVALGQGEEVEVVVADVEVLFCTALAAAVLA
jgi:hypothetical protein